MTDEGDDMSADEAVQRGWIRLRRAHLHKTDNKAAQRWDAIGQNNHLAEAVAATYRRRRESK